ncbi:MAG: UDP-2,3-diacylglucosamine diphosphatase LpxI [Candidatus Omnitrophica bacterium]|nr:UDP-2,3-diacylglucosamine diphosphatase LpxI [Candidatus Omnitrophota bacterium]MBL7210391.1 UDP-2,3-diacylglucosamine diphosphatase LpxI [Candidatus Omnitrophota bacterium]
MERIGLIAGNKKFPLLFCEGARKSGARIVAVAVKGETSPKIKNLVEKVYWIGLDEFSRIFDIFKGEGVARVALAGQIRPAELFGKQIYKSRDLRDLFAGIKDKRADTIFSAIADRLQREGLELLDSTVFLKDFLPPKGTLTSCQPDAETREDIHFGLELAKRIADLDIGQAVAVKSKAIVAVEALEGTDNMIRRAGLISRRSGVSVVKVSRPRQDMRFDIPVVGLVTIKKLISAGARCLAIEADKTLFIDREEAIKLADRKGLCVVAV